MLRSQSARRVIRNQATGLYFLEGGRWVESPDAATQYNSLVEMADLCRELGLTDVELIVETEGDEADKGVTRQ
ncbi:MAG: hypothetical protein JWR19_3020 [Pedosphaera sp.]|nr:hypothetical protein [Pedosphaera sp.]